jgi:hypothetical protein
VHAAAAPQYGAAVAVYDLHPGAADAPRSFWLQDTSGRRAGWIDGQEVREIPDASVSESARESSAPAAGDEAFGPPEQPLLSPRAVSVADPEPGMTLHVAADGRYGLRTEAWEDGALIAADSATGSGSGSDAAVASPALTAVATQARIGAGAARVKGGVVTVPLTCTALAASSCRYSVALTAKQGRRSVTIAKSAATVTSGKKVIARLKPNAAGRRLIARPGKLAATLTVSQVHQGGTPVVVRRQTLRL